MFDIGFWEILLITVVALLVVGPERLPRMVRVAGLWLGRANASLQSVRSEIARELRAEELKQALKKPDNMPNMNEVIDTDKPSAKNTSTTQTPTSETTKDKPENEQDADGKQ